MSAEKPAILSYKRSHFSAHLPLGYLYTPSHSWIDQEADGVLRVGLTRFATRMLGDMVDHGFDTAPGAKVAPGQILGWVEGFKAISDVYCVGEGQFLEVNPILKQRILVVSKDSHDTGWLYRMRGKPGEGVMDAHAYRDVLDRTITRMLEKQKSE